MFRVRTLVAGLLPAAVSLLVLSLAIADTPWQRQAPTKRTRRAVPVEVAGNVGHSVARIWNDALLDAIRRDRPKPPVHARNLFHLSVAMWDAWAAYDPLAIGYLTTEKLSSANTEAARREAISYAALRLLQYRFPGGGIDPTDGEPCQPGAAASQAAFLVTMIGLGYDPGITTTVGDSPAAVGNRIAEAVIAHGQHDGALEGFDLCYPDDSGYFSINPTLVFALPGTRVFDPNRWQPLAFDFLVLQNGIIIGTAVQSFVGVAWADTESFNIPPVPPGGIPDPTDCTTGIGAVSPIFDPGCPPQLGGVGDQEVKDSIVELIRYSSWTDPRDGAEIDLSPGVRGNNPLGSDAGTGHPVNPYTCEPYATNIVNRGDWTRVAAEFWADGPDSETPPGHWNTLAHYVTDHPDLGEKRLGGSGPLLDDLEWDVKLYLALNGAVHDAAIAAWGTKQYYDSSRPITLLRHMGALGQSTDPGLMSYHPDGLPLEPGLIEIITDETSSPGGRHEHLAESCAPGGTCESNVGQIAIFAWRGEPEDPDHEIGGAGWIRAIDWLPYQASNFVTPPFPGYTSGHSTFSRAAAVVLAEFTGSEFFPGGLGSFVAEGGAYLEFEAGPTQTTALEWATYADAADEAGLSPETRRYPSVVRRLPGTDPGSRYRQRRLDPGPGVLQPGDPRAARPRPVR